MQSLKVKHRQQAAWGKQSHVNPLANLLSVCPGPVFIIDTITHSWAFSHTGISSKFNVAQTAHRSVYALRAQQGRISLTMS